GSGAPPRLTTSPARDTAAAITAGPPRMNIGSICNPCALKKPRAKPTRTGISLFHDKLTKTTRTNLFSCAAALGATNRSTRHAINQRIKNPLRAVFTYHLLFRKYLFPSAAKNLLTVKHPST